MAAISVIVPVYNVEKYIHRCVDSILAQTFSDFELILVDDGSPDNCGRICDDYAARDSRVVVIHKENGGVSTARNIGIDKAIGNYITYIDPDDWITLDYLETMHSAILGAHADIAVIHTLNTEGENVAGIYCESENTIMNSREALYRYVEEDSDGIRLPMGKLIRKEIAQSVHFPIGRHYAEDIACVYLWYWKANVIVDIPDELYFLYYRSDSASHEAYSEKRLGEYDTLREMITFFAENEFEDLYQKWVCKYLIKAVLAYQYLRSINDPLSNRVYDIIQYAVQTYFCCDVKVESCSHLSNLYETMNPNYLSFYVKKMIRYLRWQISEYQKIPECSKLVRSERIYMGVLLLRYRKRCNISRWWTLQAYESIFPHTMKCYWIMRTHIRKYNKKIADYVENFRKKIMRLIGMDCYNKLKKLFKR